MQVFSLALRQMLILVLLAAIGFYLRRRNILSEQGVTGLSSVVMNVGLPAMILSAFDIEYIQGTGRSILLFAGLMILSLALSAVLARIIARMAHCAQNRKNVWLFAMLNSNCGFIGFPIIYALYSGTALVYASMMVMIMNLCTAVFTSIMRKQRETMQEGAENAPKTSIKKLLLQPLTITPLIGLLFYLTPLSYPAFVREVIDPLKGLCSPLALFVAGAGLVNANWKEIIRDRMIALYCLMRLLVIPAILTVFLLPLPIDDNIKIILIVGLAMPAPGITPIIAQENKGDVPFASEIVFVSTILSVLTIPIVTALLSILL